MLTPLSFLQSRLGSTHPAACVAGVKMNLDSLLNPKPDDPDAGPSRVGRHSQQGHHQGPLSNARHAEAHSVAAENSSNRHDGQGQRRTYVEFLKDAGDPSENQHQIKKPTGGHVASPDSTSTPAASVPLADPETNQHPSHGAYERYMKDATMAAIP